MLGSGIFCSTLVSWIIETQNKKREKVIQKEQREYVLSTVKNSFCMVYKRELESFSDYCNNRIIPNKCRLKNTKHTLIEIKERLIHLIDKNGFVRTAEENGRTVTINESTLRDSEMHYCLIKRNLIYYKLLHQHLLELATHFTFYLLSNVLTEKEIDAINEFTSDIHNVILLHPDDYENAENILNFKKIVFQKTDTILPLLSISEEMQIDVRYWE